MKQTRNRRELARLRRILAYSLAGTPEWQACDINTRSQIERLTYAIMRVPAPRVVKV